MYIRVATEHDAVKLQEMGNKVLAHHAAFNSFYKPVTTDDTVPLSPEKVIFVAINDVSEVVGYIQGVFHKVPQDRSYPFALIQSVWVEEVAREQGLAKSLVTTFEEAVKEKGAKQVDMFVDLQNKLGLALWDTVGYETYQEKRRKLI